MARKAKKDLPNVDGASLAPASVAELVPAQVDRSELDAQALYGAPTIYVCGDVIIAGALVTRGWQPACTFEPRELAPSDSRVGKARDYLRPAVVDASRDVFRRTSIVVDAPAGSACSQFVRVYRNAAGAVAFVNDGHAQAFDDPAELHWSYAPGVLASPDGRVAFKCLNGAVADTLRAELAGIMTPDASPAPAGEVTPAPTAGEVTPAGDDNARELALVAERAKLAGGKGKRRAREVTPAS